MIVMYFEFVAVHLILTIRHVSRVLLYQSEANCPTKRLLFSDKVKVTGTHSCAGKKLSDLHLLVPFVEATPSNDNT